MTKHYQLVSSGGVTLSDKEEAYQLASKVHLFFNTREGNLDNLYVREFAQLDDKEPEARVCLQTFLVKHIAELQIYLNSAALEIEKLKARLVLIENQKVDETGATCSV